MSGEEVLSQENKKIRGAKKHLYEDIMFDSKLEVSCYKLLKEANIQFTYNSLTMTLLESFRLDKVNYYQAGPKNRWFQQVLTKKGEKLKLPSIKYTPDFIIDTDNNYIIIETKGFENDVYSYKRKLYFTLLEEITTNKNIYFFEPRTVRQIKESILVIKEILTNETKNNTTNTITSS